MYSNDLDLVTKSRLHSGLDQPHAGQRLPRWVRRLARLTRRARR
ncbi:hypothetical protein [Deinococcus budaensis]|uniref:Uncharacterized protein n=1 Tax=Deinococcus budaensis TaxID=1665626 RepID=A0A7W8GCP2_9DEIO|nr:hypothetical protein [Deinococcus budaensis]MBB5233139.1 hypothetical protein [Deinococcus budaensis]